MAPSKKDHRRKPSLGDCNTPRLVHAVEVVLGEMVIGHDGPAA